MAAVVREPESLGELLARAHALENVDVAELASRAAFAIGDDAVRTKGKVGELLERVLGATGGPSAQVDFPQLGVELKSVPVDEANKPLESTFVCAFSLMDAERAEFETSWVFRKLACVLWVPVRVEASTKRVGRARLWSPSPAQVSALRTDFDEIVGRIAIGDIEDLSAHVGDALQLRPKAADGSVRTAAPGRDGDLVATVPRGFYLRAKFVASILNA